jgi:hypothetical protein
MRRMKAMSARGPDHSAKFGRCARMFIGSEERNASKPECISPEIDRQRARAARSSGYMPASGKRSLRYSAIASVSQTSIPSCTRQGMRMVELCSRSSAFAPGSSGETCSSTKSTPESRASRKPRSDQEE